MVELEGKDRHHLIKNPNQMKIFCTSADFKGFKKLGEDLNLFML